MLSVQAAANAAIGTGTNTATVATTGDTNAANNTATAQVMVAAAVPRPIDLQVTKTAVPATFERGDIGQYNIVVSNPAGGTPSSGTVTLTDAIPLDLIC